MRVLINAFSARQGGGQTYLRYLLQFLPSDSGVEIFILAPDSLELPKDRVNIKRPRVAWPVENPYLRAIWERLLLPGLLREIKADILFCPGGVVGTRPPKGCRTVTMFRNMIPFDLAQRRKYPLGFDRLRNWLLNRVMLKSMVHADLVIFISEYARKVIEAVAGGPLTRALVIYHGINPRFRIEAGAELPRPDWLPSEGYLLYVSTLDVFKAQVEVVRGYAILKQQRQTREKLLLVGPENPTYGEKVRSEITRLGLTGEVIVVGAIPHEALPAVYHHALISIFASESENCPNILLESLAAGRPIVASNRLPMPEFGGDAVVYFDPTSPADLAEKLAAIIDNPAYMVQLSEKALERSRLFDWDTAARLTWKAIENLHLQRNPGEL
jgi:glycosyltransferase involved in cell wall biosynthesis